VELGDVSLYHLALDSTAIPFQTCVELIAAARGGAGGPGQQQGRTPLYDAAP
jgi:hypothetical protein